MGHFRHSRRKNEMTGLLNVYELNMLSCLEYWYLNTFDIEY